MKEELWLKKIKERLDDYSEELPSDGWQRLEQTLKSENMHHHQKQKRIKIVPLHRWSVAAAAAILIGISILNLWLLNSETSEQVMQVAQLPKEPIAPQESTEYTILPHTKNDHIVMVHHEPRQMKIQSVQKSDKTEYVPSETSIFISPTYTETTENITENGKTEEGEKEVKKKSHRQRKTSLDVEVLPQDNKPKSKGWSFGLSVGGRGSVTENTGLSTPLMSSDSPIGGINATPASNINLSAMANDVITIPNGQALAFKEGLPFLMRREHALVSADHNLPISIGFSVRKDLKKGFSIETGLMYTYLSSDLHFEDSPEALSQKLHYWGIPLRANWNFIATRLFTLYLSAGGTVEKCLYGKLGSDELSQKPWQLSVLGAVGAQYNLSRHIGIYVEPGVSYYFDDGSSLQTIRKENPCSFTLQAGLRLTY